MSSGLVHGTASPASTIRIVLEVPSGKLRGMCGPFAPYGGEPSGLPENGVMGPVKTWRYVEFASLGLLMTGAYILGILSSSLMLLGPSHGSSSLNCRYRLSCSM